MGALHRKRRTPRTRTRARRHAHALAALGAAALLVGAVAACEPTAGGLDSTAVSLTTDQTGTRALERAGVKVQWLSCTSDFGERSGAGTAAPGTGSGTARPVRNIATVDCEGETTDRKKITIKGKVTEERDGRCVRGSLTARVAGSTVFQANVLGNCAAAPTDSDGPETPTPPEPPTATPPPDEPTTPPRPTVTETVRPTSTPPPSPEEPTTHPPSTPPVTVTVTSSPDPPPTPPDPSPCGCETPDPRDAGAAEHAR